MIILDRFFLEVVVVKMMYYIDVLNKYKKVKFHQLKTRVMSDSGDNHHHHP